MMSLKFRVVNRIIKSVTRLICKVEDDQLVKVPHQGPLILVCNHINFIEVPLMFTHLQPRPVIGYAKAESWDNPVMGRLFTLWEGIPLHRGEADTNAIRQGLKVLEQGKILVITPEGTRNGDGRLRRGHAGVVMLALRSRAPMLPLVYYGHENYKQDFRKLKRPGFHIAVGRPFQLAEPNQKISSESRQQMTDEIMYQLAALMPESYRGEYADLSKATTQYIVF